MPSPHYDLHHCDSNNVHVINFYNHINYWNHSNHTDYNIDNNDLSDYHCNNWNGDPVPSD